MNRKLDNSLIALTASGLALVAIALLAAPALDPAPVSGAAPAVESAPDADAVERRSRTVGRRGLAMPYFSFARGVRRIGG
ncbi:hypothetical protein H9645_01375 [Luteimonas sp. Sa2BVA3]|uniref:Uncharacterized protein n=1 Tax=Luteimonas colneyensis TaxID=2762230 RepID=A0ABR8UF69_9GAMM|nr:hypothetical protein [Luteimonas colneyensis]MBD7986678.1 hypothetical protein [Luteimonas colneyensis]